MSNEDNSKQPEENAQQVSAEDSPNKQEGSAQNEEQKAVKNDPKQSGEKAQKMVGNILSSLLKLKEEKPKVFFGALGGIVVLIVIVMLSGGPSSTVSGPAIKNLVIGQRYVLQSPNTADKNATIRLVSVPGTIAAYDDTEEDDRIGGCKHMSQGTPVTVLGFQDAYGKKNAFVNEQIEQEGECKGTSAWTLAINVQ